MKNSCEWIVIKTSNKERFFLKCREKNITILNCIEEKETIRIKIYTSDYKKVKSIWFIEIIDREPLGMNLIKKKWKKNKIFFVALAIGLCMLYLFSHLILSVEVIHSSEEIRFLVSTALEEKGIKKNTWKKDYQEIEKIKEEILDMYPDKLEWMEIETTGMKYIVRIEERKMEEENTTPKSCNVIATKDGIIKEMIYSSGEAIFKRNDSVKEGDILISGTIKKDEETKNYVCATGSVYAEVWYEVHSSIPLTYETFTKTGKVRYNIRLKNNGYNDFLLKSRVDTYEEEDSSLFTLFGTEVLLVKQYETTKTTNTYTEEEAEQKALEEALDKITLTLEEKEKIIAKKVLKKEVNNSTMNIEVFVSVLEQIGERQEFEVMEE